ncbi:MAG: LEA type 2 family protein [Nitrososphaerales archaeon]
MDRERVALVALLLVVLAGVAAEVSVSHSTPPQSTQPRVILGNLELLSTSVGTTSLGSSGPGLSLAAVIYNPNGFGATLKEANYSVYADGRYVGSGESSSEYDLTPRSSQTVAFPVTVGWRSVLETTWSYLLGGGHVTWTVKGTADTEIGGLTFHVGFEFTAG